jgi:heptosyltransferase-1
LSNLGLGSPNGHLTLANRILIIRLSAIGDVIVTTPVARALREAMPDAYLAWVVEPRAREVLAGNPYLDQVIVWDRPKGALTPASMLSLHRQLRPLAFDVAIDFQGLLRSALVARLSGARTVIGNREAREHADLLYDVKVSKNTADRSNRQRCLDLLRPLGIESRDRRMAVPVAADQRESASRLLRNEGVAPGEPYACLVPATTWAQKHWFERCWSELARLLRRRTGLHPVLMGGPGDVPLAERIREEAGAECAVAAGKTSMREAVALLEGARLTVAVDTALMHASVAVGTPTVALCGASNWPAFADYENFTLLREDMPCSPCLHHPTCGGRFDCMQRLTPERVFAAVEALLDRRVPLVL